MTWYNLELTEPELVALEKFLVMVATPPDQPLVVQFEPRDAAALDVVREKLAKLRGGA